MTLPIESAEALVAPVRWLGAQDSRVAALRPFERQGGLVTTWAEALPRLAKRRAHLESAITRMLLMRTLVEHRTPDGFSLEIDKWATVKFGRTQDFLRWAGDAAGLALVSRKDDTASWALLGHNGVIGLGAFATQTDSSASTRGCLPDELCVPVQLSVAPLRPEYAAQLRAVV